MSARGLGGWLKGKVQVLLDPDKEERINGFAVRLHKQLSQLKRQFVLADAMGAIDVPAGDQASVRRRVYERCVDRAWEDLTLSPQEDTSLKWIASALELGPKVEHAVKLDKGKLLFEAILDHCLAQTGVDEARERKLHEIASWMGQSVGSVVEAYFADEVAGFLRSLFLSAVGDGVLSHEEWQGIVDQSERLGMPRTRLYSILARYAEGYIEQVFADASADGVLATHEEAGLQWLLQELPVSPPFLQYARQQIAELNLFTQISAGRLPSVAAPSSIELRSGEIAHFFGPATHSQVRIRRGEAREETFSGNLVVTDNRLIFTSAAMIARATRDNASHLRTLSSSGIASRSDTLKTIRSQKSSKRTTTHFLTRHHSLAL